MLAPGPRREGGRGCYSPEGRGVTVLAVSTHDEATLNTAPVGAGETSSRYQGKLTNPEEHYQGTIPGEL